MNSVDTQNNLHNYYIYVHAYVYMHAYTCTCMYNLLNQGRANDCMQQDQLRSCTLNCHHYDQLTIHLHQQLVECVLLLLVALHC